MSEGESGTVVEAGPVAGARPRYRAPRMLSVRSLVTTRRRLATFGSIEVQVRLTGAAPRWASVNMCTSTPAPWQELLTSVRPSSRNQVDRISEATHGGTHMDAPLHFHKGGWSVADIPIERLMYLPIAKLDVTSKAKADPNYSATVPDILDWERRHGKVPDGSFFILQTGQSRFWPNRKAYMGLDEKGDRHFPSISAEAATFLIRERQPYGIGVEGPSLDKYPVISVHQILAAANVYSIEYLADPSQLPATGALAIVLPMSIPGAGGAPVRVVATIP
ncbi:hypothetical protein HPB50_018141 [Hyalomma asiaticum]|uniref:Uncharacterized protein n=1 Tax=Hyalomma asiaticum TaxID=266040 RepID=A0ACB7SRT5_HYAAI|nr:hypothetical protein HPB50_018141 [Hyalomma asiaticum]